MYHTWTVLLCAIPMILSIPLGDVNIIVTTDMHSWFSGHWHPDHSPILNAGLGDFSSFVDHYKDLARDKGYDVFVFDNGDVIDGSGLSNMSPVDGRDIFPIMQMVPYDALNIGNHELYHNSTVNYMVSSGYIDSWNGRFLTSNTFYQNHPGESQRLGAPFVVLEGPVSGIRLLVFGFLFNMENHCGTVNVHTVEMETKKQWFKSAISQESYDSIIVLSHMDYQDSLLDVILSEIRSIKKNIPVQFLTGHSHIRGWQQLDFASSSFEAGHFLDTFGVASFNISSTSQVSPTSPVKFHHDFVNANILDASKVSFSDPLQFPTKSGLRISDSIHSERSSLGLLESIGCSPQSYVAESLPDTPNSLWGLYLQSVAPRYLFSPPFNRQQVLIQSSGTFRYDIYKGDVIRDDIWTVLPFGDGFSVSRDVSGATISEAFQKLNLDSLADARGLSSKLGLLRSPILENLPAYFISSNISLDESYDVFVAHFDLPEIQSYLEQIETSKIEFTPVAGINDTSLFFEWASSLPKICTAQE